MWPAFASCSKILTLERGNRQISSDVVAVVRRKWTSHDQSSTKSTLRDMIQQIPTKRALAAARGEKANSDKYSFNTPSQSFRNPPSDRRFSRSSPRVTPLKPFNRRHRQQYEASKNPSLKDLDTDPSTRQPFQPRDWERETLVPREILLHKAAMERSFPDGWAPIKKISREAMDGLRTLNRHDPDTYTTPVLSKRFQISPEAVRRILKSKWEPHPKRLASLAQRESQARQAMIARRRQEISGVPEILMDEDSEKVFSGEKERLDSPIDDVLLEVRPSIRGPGRSKK